MKSLLLLILLSLASIVQLFEQAVKPDSVTLKTKIAIADAKRFKLDKQTWKAYRKHQIGYTSDYFKPTNINTTNYNFLTDSVYVKAFREAAFKKAVRRSTIRHYIITGVKQEVIVTIGIAAFFYIIISALVHS